MPFSVCASQVPLYRPHRLGHLTPLLLWAHSLVPSRSTLCRCVVFCFVPVFVSVYMHVEVCVCACVYVSKHFAQANARCAGIM